MKNSKLFSALFAAGLLAGVAIAKFGSFALFASLPGDLLFAIAASLAIAGFAIYDYSRRHEPLRPRTPVSRPALPSVPPSWRVAPAPARGATRRTAVNERTAA